jgi:hypothetical protein
MHLHILFSDMVLGVCFAYAKTYTGLNCDKKIIDDL